MSESEIVYLLPLKSRLAHLKIFSGFFSRISGCIETHIRLMASFT